MSISVEQLSTHIGAEVAGIDLRELDAAALKTIRQLLIEHHVLFFRNQPIEPAELITLAERFGVIDIHAFGRHLEGLPKVGLLDQTDPEHDGANRYHTDSTFMEQPPLGAILRAVQLPSIGGDTTWVSTIAAYERLSPVLQRTLDNLTATHDVTGPLVRAVAGGHSVGSVEEISRRWPPISHPVVCRHPETGRKFLYVNSNFTTHLNELNEAESDALLRFLFEHVKSPEHQVRFRWQEGSIALWDNRCTQHYAAADYRERRIMHRVTIAGTWAPSAA